MPMARANLNLSDYDSREMDEAYDSPLSPDESMTVTLRRSGHLKESQDRLNPKPADTSRPPSSQAPLKGAAMLPLSMTQHRVLRNERKRPRPAGRRFKICWGPLK